MFKLILSLIKDTLIIVECLRSFERLISSIYGRPSGDSLIWNKRLGIVLCIGHRMDTSHLLKGMIELWVKRIIILISKGTWCINGCVYRVLEEDSSPFRSAIGNKLLWHLFIPPLVARLMSLEEIASCQRLSTFRATVRPRKFI